MTRRRLDRAGKSVVVALCAYEAAAILTGKLPMVSQVCRRRRWIEAGLLAILLVHLHHDQSVPEVVIMPEIMVIPDVAA